MAQSVRRPTSAQVRFSSPMLTARSLEPASDSVSSSLSAPPPLVLCLCLSLSLSKINFKARLLHSHFFAHTRTHTQVYTHIKTTPFNLEPRAKVVFVLHGNKINVSVSQWLFVGKITLLHFALKRTRNI